MRLHQVNKGTLISFDHVIKVEIESVGKYGATHQVRWHLQDRTTYVQQETFKDHMAAFEYVMRLAVGASE